MAHYNAPKYYWDLHNNTLHRFDGVVAASFFGAMKLVSIVAFTGFCTFGAASQGLKLNNYAMRDGLMASGRAAVALSVMFSYPLAFVGAKDGLLDLWRIPPRKRETRRHVQSLDRSPVGSDFYSSSLPSRYPHPHVHECRVIHIFPSIMILRGAAKYPELAPHYLPAALTAVLGLLLALLGLLQAAKAVLQSPTSSFATLGMFRFPHHVDE
ncbi:hypothetical protein ACA910_018789 [Epithemia clementina (nom. ined.)]